MTEIPFQSASLDIWDTKYRLKTKDGVPIDRSIEDTYRRVAETLSSVETSNREYWYKEFLWAMEQGVIPAGRIMSNAGALQHKPATSTINCTVSGTIEDSMDGILKRVWDAGITLKAGCGIGYDFSTLRPKGAYVAGAGAFTSGPLSFMDIFDKMCFTVASAGGRRGAQMATFDIGHPDVVEFILAKREDGRLRQFNLSLLITEDFMEAVKFNKPWPLAFPITQKEVDAEGLDIDNPDKVVWRKIANNGGYVYTNNGYVACRISKVIPAVRLWDIIMSSTYDYAEPGFILIDKVNDLNNNWWCEDIRATNPCVTGDTLILTKTGYITIDSVVGIEIEIWNGLEWSWVLPKITGMDQEIYDIEFSNGSKLSCTPYHTFLLQIGRGIRIKAKDMEVGAVLQQWNLPGRDEDGCVITCKGVKVTSITLRDTLEPKVYCFNEPKNHTVLFNDIMTGNCGEQPLPPEGSCLLGSINLTKFVRNAFTKDASFDRITYRKVIHIFTRMLDNVVEINGLPLQGQRDEIFRKRRHGMGYLGLGSTITMLGMSYGDGASLEFTECVTKELAVEGWKAGLDLAQEKGPAPIMTEVFEVTKYMVTERPEILTDGYKVGDAIPGMILFAKYSRYMQRIAEVYPALVEQLAKYGSRFTHHSSIAPTGTISLSLANNASNGIEPSFAHHYSRNVIREGKKSKEKVDVYSFELLAYRTLINPNAIPYTEDTSKTLPSNFISAEDVTPKQHVDIQAAAQKWIDSSISKTANVPTDYPYEDFKNIYQYAYEKGLKGCTTFRFNPEVFQGVLVKESDLENTLYQFTLDDGTVVEFKGNDDVEYDGEVHSAANLFDALKEGYYGKF